MILKTKLQTLNHNWKNNKKYFKIYNKNNKNKNKEIEILKIWKIKLFLKLFIDAIN